MPPPTIADKAYLKGLEVCSAVANGWPHYPRRESRALSSIVLEQVRWFQPLAYEQG